MAGKWLQPLTEIAPTVRRVAIMFNPGTAPGGGSYFLPSFEAAAQSLKVALITAPIRTDAEFEPVIASLGREPGSGLVVMPDGGFMPVHRALLISLAAQNKVPAVYADSRLSQRRRFAFLWSRVGRFNLSRRPLCRSHPPGRKAADLPVQAPTKFEMALNIKTAKALGLMVPPSILLRADEVIE